MVGADCAAATPFLIHDRQTRGSMLMKFPAPFFNRLMRAAARGGRSHDFLDANFRSNPVISPHATTHVALSNDTHQFAGFCILNDRRATAARIAHCERSLCHRVFRRAARRRFYWFHYIFTATHFLFSIL